ncbi:peptidoglycan-binding protein [Bacillus sp. T33-2]|nr:peptidoglycan-binding protein [Bacillus sp. T33-2]
MKKLVIGSMLLLSSFFVMSPQSEAAGNTHRVQPGETYWKIANKYGMPTAYLKRANNAMTNQVFIGQNLRIPNYQVSEADKDLIAHIVHAEAKGEPYAGKVAVATVILNRVASPDFPDTVKSVIYQKVNGHYAFTPVQDGSFNQEPDAASRRAVNEALAFRGQGNGSLFFYNPKTSVSDWIFSRQVTVTIGKHRFAK